jgi:hypothetical protein
MEPLLGFQAVQDWATHDLKKIDSVNGRFNQETD